MASKIKIKMSGIEIEYEGDHEFLQSELLSLVKNLMDIAPEPGDPPPAVVDSGAEAVEASVPALSSIASRLSVDSGPSLVKAALYQAEASH